MLARSALFLTVDGVAVPPSLYVKKILQCFDMRHIVTFVAKACFFHLRRIWQIRRDIDVQASKPLVFAFVLSKLDYGNLLLTGLPSCVIRPLTSVLHFDMHIVSIAVYFIMLVFHLRKCTGI